MLSIVGRRAAAALADSATGLPSLFSHQKTRRMLPVEILIEILVHAIPTHPQVTSILRVNSLFLSVSRCILHQHLRFASVAQLDKFTQTLETSTLACSPRNITVILPGGASGSIFVSLDAALVAICRDPSAQVLDDGRLELDNLRFVLNSRLGDKHPEKVYDALSRVNPTTFLWTGPDPPHHFSTAIVATITPYLFIALSEWTRLRELTLTNMAFYPSAAKHSPPLPVIPSLRSFYLGQVVCLHANAIATYLLSSANVGLRSMTLVDVYHESIWGPRVKKDHILAAVPDDLRDTIASVLDVGSRTQRIDRYTEW